MGQRVSNNNLNLQELNPLNEESIDSNQVNIQSNNGDTVDFESIVDQGGEIIYAPPKVIQSPIIKCLLNIHPKSLQFEQNHLGLWRLKFLFDCEEDSEIQIYYSAKEIGEKDEFLFEPLKNGKFNSVIRLKKGYNIEVKQEWEEAINFGSFKNEDLKYDIIAKRYPLIIISKIVGNEIYNMTMNDEKKENKSVKQISYFNLTRKEGEITAHLLQQKIEFNRQSYIVQEIYGVESSQGGECVVCMAEPRNVVVLPCRHMCLCVYCADIYRIKTNKCPICRGPSRSFIKVNDDKGDDDESSSSTSTSSSSSSNTTTTNINNDPSLNFSSLSSQSNPTNNNSNRSTNTFNSPYFDEDI